MWLMSDWWRVTWIMTPTRDGSWRPKRNNRKKTREKKNHNRRTFEMTFNQVIWCDTENHEPQQKHIVQWQEIRGHRLGEIHRSWKGDVGQGSRWVWQGGELTHTQSLSGGSGTGRGEAEGVVAKVGSEQGGSQLGRGTVKEQTDWWSGQAVDQEAESDVVDGECQTATGMGRRTPGSVTAGFVVRGRRPRHSQGIRRGRHVGDRQVTDNQAAHTGLQSSMRKRTYIWPFSEWNGRA